ncbi:MAG: puo 1 [Mucilaginibacter sp.]|nr:puo 1 [Mucilaginibacter sp.]
MSNTDILIIGAGAAGLMAARTLAKAGKKVIVLEARDRCGGRIHTLNHQSFFGNAELGAEFVHGDLPVTLDILKQAGIPYYSASAEMWRYKNGHLNNEGFFTQDWELLIKRLNKLEEDINIDKFLQKEFSGDKYQELRDSVWKFASGYDTADPHKASAFALRKEWQSEDTDAQHRIKGGYGAMIKYLEEECKKYGGFIYLNTVVKEIHWQPGNVKVATAEGTFYEARQVLIALPLGVLQEVEAEKGTVVFYPPVPEQSKAIQSMGFGAVIKILLEFDELFWEDKFAEELAGRSLKNMGYLFSDEEIPTWWTQTPQHSPVLTGWIGGSAAANKKHTPDEEILKQSLQSLGKIFNRKFDELKDKLLAFKIVNWTAEPFTCGSYAYDTIASPVSRKALNTPVNDTLFFAGDYLYEGPIMGTVEAALTSGKEMAEKMIKA